MPVGRRNKNAPRHVAAEMLAGDALRLRRDGLSYSEIGKALNCHKATAYRAIIHAMAKLSYENKEEADQLLAKEWATTELLIEKAMDAVEEGDMEAVRAAVHVLNRRAKYRGFDMPAKIEANITGGDAFMSRDQLFQMVTDKLKILEKAVSGKSKKK